ncbi:hypothetical protein A0O28_0007680 [Trichoderma guizhouense]|uniref:Carrier domain-containing protein n=1 Tax=Trichoderma guizhouense TaxID=1491466 RepID=A0A1T3CHW2_9HYPO|nr:hypothetical protein A0O28_0007680 [Trichoderma guizhouense]
MSENFDTVVIGRIEVERSMISVSPQAMEAKGGPISVASHETTETDTMSEGITSADSASEDLEFGSTDVKNAFLVKFPEYCLDDIEDVYPCTPLQEGILTSQTQGTEDYIIRATMELHSVNGATFDLERLQKSWDSIVRQSAALRTVFVQSTSGDGLFHQIVLRNVPTGIQQIQAETLNEIATREPSWEDGRVAPHCLIFCKPSNGPDGLRIELHHGVSDAISSMKILHELMRLYDDPTRQLMGVPFRSFVQHLQSNSEEEKLKYWQTFLEGSQPSMFPKLRVNRTNEELPQRCRRQVNLDRDGILDMVKSSKVSFSMLFHAAWSVLLRAYLGRDDVAFGYISSGRHNVPLPEIQEALGTYISMMVARARMDETTTLVDLASQLRKNIANSLPHEQCSLASIQRRMQINGGFFNTLVDVQRRPKLRRTSDEISLNLTHVHTVAEYDIVVNIEDTGDELLFVLDYKSNLLGEADAENLISCFTSIVGQILQSPHRRIAELDLFTKDHRNQLLQWNQDQLPVTDACAHDLFEAEAARHPEKIAVCSLDNNFTYARLSMLSTRLAAHLRSLGASPGVMIPLCMEKSVWAIVSMLGVLKAGAAFVPLDPASPTSRIEGILEDTNARIVITSTSTSQKMSQLQRRQHVVVIDEALEENEDVASTGLRTHPSAQSQDTAYVLFTSGSTGKPKGVVVPHQSLCCSVYAHGPATGIDENTRALQFGAYTFDSIIAEIFTVLVHGGCVCVPSDEERMNNVASFIERIGVNWVMLTPTFVRTLNPDSIPGVHTLVLIGEAVDKDCVDTWLGKVRLFNGYGPTETTVICVACQFPQTYEPDPTVIGKPVGCRAWVVDPVNHDILSPIGAVGELVIEGPNITKGYLGDTEKTLKSFISQPSWVSRFAGAAQETFAFYKTGDLVRQLSDGSLKFCGRGDSQAKVNGQRLELGEVETHLLSDDFTIHALAEVPKSGPFQGRLVTVLSLNGLTGPKENKDAVELQFVNRECWNAAADMCIRLMDKLHSALPAYMVPTVWVPVEKMPLLPSGKLDRRQIRTWLTTVDEDVLKDTIEFQTSGIERNTDDEALFQENETGRRLRKIWSETLNIPETSIGASNAFLSVGGDSISAMKVVAKARAQDIFVTVQEILQHRTISAIIDHLQTKQLSVESPAAQKRIEQSHQDIASISAYQRHHADFDYWNMTGRPNLQSDSLSTAFELDEETTSTLLGTSNDVLRTEPAELLMGILLHAFKATFTDRDLPTIFAEEDRIARLSDDRSSEIIPVSVISDDCADISQTTRKIKDARRILLNNLDYGTGLAYHEDDNEGMEILFKYRGMHSEDKSEENNRSTTSRQSLVHISVIVESDKLVCTIQWSPNMAHQEKIRTWIEAFESMTRECAQVGTLKPLACLSDYPLLPYDYEILDNVIQKVAPQWKLLGVDEIEDIYPCSPCQEGMIISQIRHPDRNLYNHETTWKVTPSDGRAVDPSRLEAACRIVIQRHQILRTVFCEAGGQNVPFVQVVFKDAASLKVQVSRSDLSAYDTAIPAPKVVDPTRFPYHLAVCESPDGVSCKFVINHALLDGSCLRVLIRELSLIYDQISLPTPPLFSSFINYLLTNPTDDSYAYWNSRLDGISSSHFPSLNDCDESGSTPGRLDIAIPEDQVAALRTFCREHGVTLAAVMSTVWALVLQTYIGNDTETVCFGYMASGRDVPVPYVHELMGPLLNMLVQKVDLQPSTTIASLVSSVYDGIVGNLPHQNCSLAKIQSGLGLGGQSLFNTLVNVQKVSSVYETDTLPAINWELVGEGGPAEYDVIFGVVDSDEGIMADLLFWTSCISEAQAVDLRATLLQTLSSLLESSGKSSVSEIQVFSESHGRQLHSWNAHNPHIVESCLHQLFEEQVAIHPDAAAISTTSAEANWTYAQLNDVSTRLAAHLQTCGVETGMALPFCFDRSPWTVASMLAILKSGGACVALDPSYPIQRLKDIIRITGARIVVCEDKYTELFEGLPDLMIVSVSPDLWDRIPQVDGCTSSVTPSDPAFVNFTSGSTGVPKGNILEHKSIASALWHHRVIDPLGRQARGLHFASYTFDMSFAEILLVLCSGGCLCIPTEYERLNSLAATINKLQVNWAYLTPTVASLLDPSEVPSLKTICLGGEPVLDTLVTKWINNATLVATYGPSECSIAISRSIVRGFGNGQLGPASGGLLWVVNPVDHNKLVPLGAPGELLIEGPLVGRDYLDATLAKATFIVDPAWTKDFPVSGIAQAGRRMYKTGDIVRFNKDGSMTMLGRKAEDAQAKIHGQRVDLGEVSHHITASDMVKHAVCFVAKKGLFANRLTAIISSMDLADAILGFADQPLNLQDGPEAREKISDLRHWLEDRVPSYMMPRSWILLEKVPVTLNGKLNRRVLLQWLESVDNDTYESILTLNNDDETNALALPGSLSPMEESLAKAWSHVLNVPEGQISVNQSFFSLGGDSISAIKVSSRLLNEDIQVSMHDILHYRTLSEIAKRATRASSAPSGVQAQIDATDAPFSLLSRRLSDSQFEKLMTKVASNLEDVGTNKDNVEDIYPCSPMQEGILFSRARQDGLYDLINDFKIVSCTSTEPVSLERFRRAIDLVTAQHQSLRSFFVEGDDATPYVQVVKKTVEAPVVCISSSNSQEPFKDVVVDSIPLHGLGYRFVLCQVLPTGDVYGRLEINHALIDGQSMKVLITDLLLAYDEQLPLSHSPPLYGDFIKYLEQLSTEKSLEYWTSVIRGLEPCILPSLNNLQDQHMCNDIDEILDPHLTELIFQFCRNYDTTIATVISAVWALVLRAYVGMDTVCFGLLTSGRAIPVPQAESIIGPLITMMVSRVDMNAEMPILEMIRSIHDGFLNGLEHQHTSLAAVQQAFDEGRQRGKMFNTVVNVLKGDVAAAEESPSSIKLEVMDASGPTEYDASLDVVHTDTNISLSFSYWTSCLSNEQAKLMQQTLLHVLESLVQGASGRVGDLDILSEAHKSHIMQWASEMPPTNFSCVHEHVEKRAKMQPDVDAIVTSDLSITYDELERLSSLLAAHLAFLGVRPEVMVPFFFDKSPWTIVVMYAILKAGGSCVALSPEFPDSRLTNMIEATEATLAICDSKYVDRLQTLIPTAVPIDTSASTASAMMSRFEALSSTTPSQAKPYHPAIIAFTSGSTGTPKGIILTHASMSTSMFAHGPLVQMSESSRVLQFSSYTFDASLEEIFTTLAFGGTICVPTEYERMNELPAFIKAHHVNFAALTPTVASLLNPEELPLKTVDIAGEVVPQTLASKWATHTNLVVTYGPAECSIISSGMLVHPNHVQNGTLGKPAGTLMWIVDANDHNKLVPIGCAGEILIEGPLLARGYINKDQTEKSFIFDPSWTQMCPVSGAGDQRRLYKTGDLARYEPDGSIIYLGRMDSQVKIHGQRVDLGEVETALSSHGVSQSTAMVPKNGHFTKKLVVVFSKSNASSASGRILEVMTDDDVATHVAELRKGLQIALPGYMLPRVWVPVEALPLNPNGKLDRRSVGQWLERLDEEACERILALGNSLKPASELTDVEKLLVSVWSEALGLPKSMIDVDQPFFSLGGDSVSAIRVASQLRSQGIHLAVHDIFRHRTVSALAELITSENPNLAGAIGKIQPFPLTPSQLMQLRSHAGTTSTVAQKLIAKLKRRVNFDEMNAAFKTLSERHPMLTAHFERDSSGTWSQRLVDTPGKPLELGHLHATSLEEAQSLFLSMQPDLDIAKGPLVAASLVDIESVDTESSQLLILAMHSLIADDASLRVILEDLETLLLHAPAGCTPASFQDWALAQFNNSQRRLSNNSFAGILGTAQTNFIDYWGMQQHPNTHSGIKTSDISIDPDTTSLLLGKANATLRTEAVEILLAALCHSFTNTFNDRSPPKVFCASNERDGEADDSNISSTVGCFTTISAVCAEENYTTAPVSSDLETRIIQTLRCVKDQRRFAHHNVTGLEDMEVFLTYTKKSCLGTALFQEMPCVEGNDISEHQTRKSLFEVSAEVIDGQIDIRFHYHENMARQSDILAWIQAFEDLFRSSASVLAQAYPVPTLSDFPLLDVEDYVSLDNLVERCKSQAQISDMSLIESIHPCSPMQEGILLSTLRSASIYDGQEFWKVLPKSPSANLDIFKLKAACESVIARHDILRTHFVEAHHGRSAFLQVVLRAVNSPVQLATFDDFDDLTHQPLPQLHEAGILPYIFTLCELATGDIYLRLDISHALSDGVSTGILMRDLLLAYDDKLLPAGPSYRNYISHLESQSGELTLQFWQDNLKDATPCHFPLLNESGVGSSPIHRSTDVPLSIQQKDQVREFCKLHSTTLANFMSAIWAIVLPCFSDASSDTATFGYLASGRDIALPGVDDILGPMITMLIRSVNVSPETTVLGLIEEMQQDFIKSWPYQHCSLGEIHHALGLSGTPLFNTIVNLGHAGGFKKPQDMPGDILFVPENVQSRSEYDIAFNILDSDEGFWLTLSFWDRCLSEAQATVLSHTIQAAIASVLEKPEQCISAVDLVDDFHTQMMQSWNADIPEPVFDCIHLAFERQVKLQPEAPAVCSSDPKISISYKQLDSMTDNLASSLQEIGVGPESLVPFCMDKSPWTPVAMIAILKAGGACVALDPNQPIERLRSIIEASGAKVVLVAPQHKDLLANIVPHIVLVGEESLRNLEGSSKALQPTVAVSPANHNNPAFVIFTSGSTGTPKGIVVEHGAFCSSARSHAPILGLHSGTRVLQFASYTYDLSIAETFTTLMVGGCICVPSEYDRLNRLAAAINSMEVEWMFLTPTVAALLSPEQVPTVRTLVLGGEHATHNNFSTWGGRPGICLINSYGPAECSIWTNANVGVKPTSDISNLGRRLGCSLWVVDPRNHHRLFPMYARGELVIGGPTLARGYLHDPVKTDAAFIQPPAWFTDDSGTEQRLYKSGDLVYYNLDGSLSIQGRKDTQVKVHGHRIELDDINHNMARIPLIEHAMAQLPRSGPLEGRLVAVASLKEDRPLASSPQQILKIISDSGHIPQVATKLGQIRSELEKQLPKHMLPTVWVIVQKMPLLSSGKLDKRTVKAWLDSMDEESFSQIKAMSTSDAVSQLSPPENDVEFLLQKVWSEVLKCEPSTIGVTVSFLGLGGDSISAMQAVSKARAAGLNIFVQDIFRLKTIRKLAEQAGLAGRVDEPIATPGRFGLLPTKGPQQLTRLVNDCASLLHLDGTGASIEDIFPCSPMQEGILISQARSPDRYHVRALFEVLVQSTELVDVDRLEQAWIKVAQRHQALRSVFLEESFGGENMLQVVLDRVTVPVLKLECEKLEDFTESTEVNQYAKDGPPYRFSICKLPSGVVYCHLAMTHALDDGSSMRALLRDICLSYDDLLPSGDPPLYSNFISYIQRQSKDAGLKFWQSYLSGVGTSHFPALTTRASADPTEDGIVERWIEGDKASSLLRLCEEHDITIADVFKTVWAIVLRSFVGADSVCFGYLASGRDAPIKDVHNIMGPLINMLVFYAHVDKSKSLIELCKEANDSYLQALPHQQCSLKEILHAVRGPGQSAALFNTVVNVQKGVTAFFADEQDSIAHRTIDLRSRIFHDPTEYELSIDIQNFESSIAILMNYWTSLLSEEQADRLIDLVLDVVESLLDNPMQTVGQLELCTSNDASLLHSWNNSPLVEEERCLHEVIEEQVASKPEAVAVVSDEGSLTFQELDSMANKLAHHLKQLGAGPEIIIPCCFEKSIWAIVAMLGVLKAGAACAALDPAHPLERLQTILKDTEAPFVLSSSLQTALVTQTGLQAVVVTEETLNKLPPCASAPSTGVKPDNKAFIVYTSGSTGTPKGAILEHRNLYASSRGFGTFGMNSESRVAHFSSYAFDVSIGETMLALTHGACVCIISEEDRLGDLTAALNRLQATFTQLTPTVVRTLEPSELPYMKTVVTAGELLTDDIINKWTDKVRLFNSYGPCECAINSTGSDLLKAGARGAVIGKPLQSRLWIVDPENDQLLVPPGAVGELVVNGPIVGRGYLNNPDRTKAAFMEMPRWATASSNAGRFYKTGDLARWTSDGCIHYLGRKDVQVKIHGQRIELGEVEYRIAEKAGSAFKAVVAAVPKDGRLKQRLVALMSLGDQKLHQGGGVSVVDDADLKSRSLAEIADIIESVKKSLPRHMIPSLWVPVHDVPKLPSGKTNRRFINQWLDEIDEQLYADLTTSSQSRVVPPKSDMEAMLQRIWGDILHLDATNISTDQSFFSLAGDSVLAMQLMARCRAEGVTVKVRDIFKYTTIAALAPRCTRAVGESNPIADDYIPQATLIETEHGDLDFDDMSNIEAVYPSSPMQSSILAIQETQKNAWFASFIVEAELPSQHKSTQMEDLAMGWQTVVDRHAVLRTSFKAGKQTGRQYQIVLKEFTAPVSYITDALSTDPTSIFNISPDIPDYGLPPHRMVLAETMSEKRVFIQLQISHALYDAVGISVLWHDFQMAYSSLRGDGVALDSMPVSPYRAFISYIEGLPKPSAVSFWKNHLEGTSPCFFPSLPDERSNRGINMTSTTSTSNPPLHGSFNSIAVPINRTSKIRAFCKEQAATTANLFQAAWAIVLRHFTKSDDVNFGFMLSGRDAPLPEVDTILGPLINLLPCTVKASGHQTLQSMLRALQSNYAETLMSQNCSLDEIRAAAGIDGPLYNTFLNMQRVTKQSPCSQSSVQFNEVDAFMTDEYAISVYVSDVGDDIFMELSYWTSVLTDEDAQMIGQAILRALDVLFAADSTDSPLSLKL